MDVEITWACKYVIFDEYYLRLEGNKPSHLKPSWRPHHHGDGDIMSVNRGFWYVTMVGCCIKWPLFSSDIMLTFMYSIVISMFDHTHNIDGNYWVITPIFTKYGNLPLFLENYALFSLPQIITKLLYTYQLSNRLYL